MPGFSSLPGVGDAEAGAHAKWSGVPQVFGPKWLQMPILTVGMMGLQIIWSVEMSYASPYILSLGISKSLMSIVFVAGPLSGLIVQPLIGVLSDGSHSRFGRRRPYILVGVLICFGAMFLFGFTRQFASLFTTKGSSANNTLTISLAVFSIYLIDFSINAVQAMDRALLVDALPASEQERGNAWAGRLFGLGSVIGFFAGNVDLTLSLPFLGGTQLEILCGVTASLLIITHFITIFNVKERILQRSTTGTRSKLGPWNAIKNIWANFVGLPRTIKQICLIQLFAWIAWFPVLFWTSLYVGGLHKRNSPVPETDVARIALEAEATRLGSRALLYNALASLVASIICPFFVSNAGSISKDRPARSGGGNTGWLGGPISWWTQRGKCHLATLWAISHGVFAVCMLSTFFIKTVVAATAIITLSGFSWAMTQWAPFALIAEAIHCASSVNSTRYVLGDADDETDEEDANIPLRNTRMERAAGEEQLGSADEGRRLMSEVKEEEDHDEDSNGVPSKRVLFDAVGSDSRASLDIETTPPVEPLGLNPHAHHSQGGLHVAATGSTVPQLAETTENDGVGVSMEHPGDLGSTDGSSIEDKAGIILGIHNVFVVIPQFIITGFSSILFAIMDPDKSVLASHGAPAHPGSLPDIPIGNRSADHHLLTLTRMMLPRAEGEAATRSSDSVAVIFRCVLNLFAIVGQSRVASAYTVFFGGLFGRIGGVSAAIACILAFRLAKELKRARR